MLACVHCLAAERRLDLRPKPVRTGSSARLASASLSHEPGILRQTDLEPGVTELPKLEVGDEIALELYDDVGRTVVLKNRLDSPVGGAAFLASAEGYDGLRNAVVVQTADGLQVDIQDFKKARVYTVASSATGTTVREIDPKAGKVAACDVLVPELKDPGERTASASAAVQPSTVVDILVAYDRDAAAWARRSGGGLDAFAQTSVAKMNAALANNGLDARFRFRLVGTTEISVAETDVHQALYAIRDGKVGWAEIKAKRDDVGADIVTVLIDTGTAYGTTGVGWSLKTKEIADFADSAYNVCAVRAVAQGHTMTHEVGHNMGAGHATEVDPSVIEPGPQLYDYSAGHHFRANGQGYYTIMCYNYDGFGNSYDPAPLFSTPDVSWEGVPAGDAKHDNARTLANTYAEVTKWRAQKVALTYDVFFSPETETYFSDSLSVTLTSGKPGLEIRYTTDGSAPTLASTRYTVPFNLSQSTTIRAATVMDGVLGPVYEAHYFKNDLGTAINAPQLAWTTSSDYPWVTQTENAYDGFAVKSSPDFADNAGCNRVSWLKTTVTGPTEMGFRYQKIMSSSAFRVYCDDVKVWSDEQGEYGIDVFGEWKMAMIAIPAGRHEVKFAFEKGCGYYYGYNGVVVDDVCFDAWSHPPTLSPETTDNQSTARTFTGSMTFVLTPPAGRTGKIFYTLDGSDPTAEGACEYAGPVTVTKSVYVQAVFVEAGLEPSVCVKGYYLERHPVKPGEWTTDVEGAKTAAAEDGRLIAVLSANRGGCGWTKAFMPVAESPEFLAWASANGVYLITSDSSELVDTDAADDYFWSLWGAGSVGYPSFAFAKPSAPDVCIASGTARNASGCSIGGVPYDDTVGSLIRGFAKVMGIASVPSAPTVSPDNGLINSLPHMVTLSNPNGAGTIYYTLDGTVPTAAHGTRYTGPVAISRKDAILTAVVIDSAGTIGIPLVRSFKLFSDFANAAFGTDGIVWTVDGPVGWQETSPEKGLRTGGYLGKEGYVSTLVAKAPGRGRLRVIYRVCSWSDSNKATFSVNGVQKTVGYTGTDYAVETVELMTTGATTLSWSYAVDDPSWDYSSGYSLGGKSAWCGIWVYDVEWFSYEPDETHYAVLFDANAGTGVMDALRMEPQRVHNLPLCTFTPPPGKRFAGWACSNGRRYDDGMLVINLAQPGETVTMTAIWE